jgi:phosphoserine aminotransferase
MCRRIFCRAKIDVVSIWRSGRGDSNGRQAVVRDDLLGHALPICPSAFDWKIVADNGVDVQHAADLRDHPAGLVFKWLKKAGRCGSHGKRAISSKRNCCTGQLDASGFYKKYGPHWIRVRV